MYIHVYTIESMLLLELVKEFDKHKVPYVLVGGYALALQGIVRATVDIDLVLSLKESHLIEAERILNERGLQSRLPIKAEEMAHFHKEYREKRNLIAWSFIDFKDPSRQVDLLIDPPIKSLKSELISVHGLKVRVATKRALLAMKKTAHRPQDQIDILRLEEAIDEEENK